jgi:hypothetical protein
VALTGQRRHLHKGAMVAPAFTAPVLAPHIQFDQPPWPQRRAHRYLRNAPPVLLAHMKDSALSEAQILLADGPGFELSDLLSHLADSERTHFASRVGAGITDLYMNALGYGWRDNAACLSSSLEPHADFLYHGGPRARSWRRARRGARFVRREGQRRQDGGGGAAQISASGPALYWRGLTPRPGHPRLLDRVRRASGDTRCLPAAVANAAIQTQGRKPAAIAPAAGPSNPVPAAMMLATHRSNFILMDALPVAGWIDWLNGARDFPEDAEPVTFLVV